MSGNGTSGAAVNVASVQPDPTFSKMRMVLAAPGAGNIFWRLIVIYLSK
jgi:hypothetical protein